MQQLLATYSIQQIILILIAVAAAIKGFIEYFDWGRNRLRERFSKEKSSETIQEQIKNLADTVNEISNKVNTLIQSDKDDIKSFLTKEHHYFCYEKHWIDDYSLDCCQKRYKHYVAEGGNSFIQGFMNELRALPKQPPQK